MSFNVLSGRGRKTILAFMDKYYFRESVNLKCVNEELNHGVLNVEGSSGGK